MILQNIANYSYEYTTKTKDYTDSADSWFSSGVGMFLILLAIVFGVFMIASMWKIFTKAGRPGWAAIVPIYGTLQLIWTAGKPWWWLLMMCIPFINFVAMVVIYYHLSKAFGKGVGYTLLLLFLPIIGFPMLAWGDATYKLKKPKKSKK